MTAVSSMWCYLKWNDWKKKQTMKTTSLNKIKWFRINLETIANILPNTHCSDRTLLPCGILPLYFPMQIPAWRTVLQTVPPQSWISSTRFWVGGWECWDTNMGGWFWNRSCWCSPADKCLWRRQIWGKNMRAQFSYAAFSIFLCSIKQNFH